ncbi:MAG: RagB/SusD family nutrient uptake outer membrane protein [Prevotellaceae bacterium]|jgi:hypothetical protein|nr:RagB/SusD family nutrient uptake outer membrane protein [Prevotellaceae bacterium]
MKSIMLYALLALALMTSGGCTKWLDGAQPIDQNLDKTQFASEFGVNSVLNGIYRTLSAEKLYGGVMTMTAIELLAHYYFYEEDLLNKEDFIYFSYMSRYLYNEADVKAPFSGVWSASYSAIFQLNKLISEVSASVGVLTEGKKSMVLGEAYGLRAFLHLDLFRLFGSAAQPIPYNTSAEVVPHEKKAPEEFFALLLQDIETAKELLKSDPILTDGVLDLTQIAPTDNVTDQEIFDRYLRCYRMNYYAVQALQARALMFKGDAPEAARVAQSVINNALGDDKPFRWADKNSMEKNRDYIFYSEVIFGIYNLDLYTTWEKHCYGSRPGKTYAVAVDNLTQNIFKFDNTGGDMSLWEDLRVKQWVASRAGQGLMVSYKLANFTRTNENDPRFFFQPLIRMSEMYYIVAESFLLSGKVPEAVTLLNEVRFRRGSQRESLPNPNDASADLAFDLLEAEYYKEFYAEGQAFFYLKRRQSNKIFDANRGGKVNVATYSTGTTGIYDIPIPESETNL